MILVLVSLLCLRNCFQLEDLICFQCQNPGHFARDYTGLAVPAVDRDRGVRGGGRGGGRGRGGRAFMAPMDARGGLQGTFLHDGLPCRVLFDSCASHSFISRQFCLSRGLVILVVSQQINVSTLTRVSVDLPEMVHRYEIRFMGRTFVLDMFVLGFEGLM